jgi:hypothetical protein
MVDGRDARIAQAALTVGTPEHEHYFARATVLGARGEVMPEGRRCPCGDETIDGINAPLVRASQRMNAALAQSAQRIVAVVESVDLPAAAARDLARINRAWQAAQDRVRER